MTMENTEAAEPEPQPQQTMEYEEANNKILSDKKPANEKKEESGELEEPEVDMIKNPVALAFFNFFVNKPKYACSFLVIAWMVTLFFGGEPYETNKAYAMNHDEIQTMRMKAFHDDVMIALTSEFPQQMTETPMLTNIVIYAEEGKALSGIAGTDAYLADVMQNVKESMYGNPDCLKFQPFDMPPITSGDGSAMAVSILIHNLGGNGTTPALCEASIAFGLTHSHDPTANRTKINPLNGVKVGCGSISAALIESASSNTDAVQGKVDLLKWAIIIFIWFMVGTIARAFISLATIQFSLSCTNTIILIIRTRWPEFNIAGSDETVSFILMALGVDYAMFFWTRFSQERRRNPAKKAFRKCILRTLKTSGCVIFMSMMALVVAYAGLCCYPYQNATGDLKNNIALIIGVLVLGILSMAVPAAAASECPGAFDEPKNGLSLCGIDCDTFAQFSTEYSPLNWYFRKNSAWITRAPGKYLAPALVYCMFVPLLCVLATKTMSYDMNSAQITDTLPAYQTYQVLMNRFERAPTVATPVLLTLEPMGSSPVLPSQATSMMQVLMELGKLEPNDATQPSSRMDSPTMSPAFGKAVCRFAGLVQEKTRGTSHEIRDQDIAGMWYNGTTGKCNTEIPDSSLKLFNAHISKDGLRQVMYLWPQFQPMSTEAKGLTQAMKNDIQPAAATTIDVDGQRYKFKVDHYSQIGRTLQMEEGYKNAAIWVLPITAIIVCVLFGFLFNSVGISIKLGATVILPLCASYGVTVGVYQYGWLECLGIHKVEGGLLWMYFYTGMSFLFALAVDYDMFLFARVYEYRHMGYDNQSAVILSQKETGPVITTAGMIMGMSFFGLLFTGLPYVQMMGFLYFTGVVIDTFIVRIFVAPAVLCLREEFNFWPGKLPPVIKNFKEA